MARNEHQDVIVHGDLTAAFIQSSQGAFLNNQRATGVGNGVDPTDAPNKAQLDAMIHVSDTAPDPNTTKLWVDTGMEAQELVAINEVYQSSSQPVDPNVELWIDLSQEGTD